MSASNKGRVWPIYLIAGFISVLLSLWMSTRELVINPDGICYLMSAEALNSFSISQVMQLCAQAGWPFYSWLIHGFMTVTGVSSLVAANTLDGFFSLISVLTFMALTQLVGGSRRVLIFAAFVILFSHEFNSVRQYIVRDHGYWAFYLLSLFFFIRCVQRFTFLNLLAFAGSLFFATLFRIEGAVFFLLLPFAALVLPKNEPRLRYFLGLASPCLVGVALLLCINALHPILQSGRLLELWQYLTQSGTQMITHFNDAKTALMVNVLPLEAARDAGTVWFLTLFFLYFTNILQNLSLIVTLLLAYALYTGCAAFSPKHRLAIVAYVLVNLVITVVFFAEHLFLSKRYLVALTLVLTLWVPFALDKLFELSVRRLPRLVYMAALLLIVLSSMGVFLDRGPSKAYVREAGEWLAVNVPLNASLYINDSQLMYYAKHDGFAMFKKIQVMREPSALANGQWHHYDYVALRVRANDTGWATVAIDMNQQPLRTYSGSHGDSILIYKTGM